MTFVPRVIKCPPWKSRKALVKRWGRRRRRRMVLPFVFVLTVLDDRQNISKGTICFISNRRFFREKVERQHTNLHEMNAFWQTKKSINTGANVDLLLQNTERRLLCLRWKFTCRFVCDVLSQLGVHMELRWSSSGLTPWNSLETQPKTNNKTSWASFQKGVALVIVYIECESDELLVYNKGKALLTSNSWLKRHLWFRWFQGCQRQ